VLLCSRNKERWRATHLAGTLAVTSLRTDYAIGCDYPDRGSGGGGSVSPISGHSACPASLLKRQSAIRYFAMDRSRTNYDAKRNSDGNIRDR